MRALVAATHDLVNLADKRTIPSSMRWAFSKTCTLQFKAQKWPGRHVPESKPNSANRCSKTCRQKGKHAQLACCRLP